MTDFSSLTRQLLNGEIKFNVCELSPQYDKEIREIDQTEFKSSNISDTVITFGTLLDMSTTYESNIVSKIFVDYSIEDIFIDSESYNDAKQKSDLLQYEVKMYRYITDNIIKTNISPNFIGYIGYGECSVDSISSSTRSKLKKFFVKKTFRGELDVILLKSEFY